MTTSGTKLNSLGSTLPRSSVPSISFSLLSNRLHFCCRLMLSDCLGKFSLNCSRSKGSFRFGTINGSLPSFHDVGSSYKLGPSVIPFLFVKFITTFVLQAVFSCISCCPFSVCSILRVFSLVMSDLTILDPFLVLWLQILWIVQNSNQLGLPGAIFLQCIILFSQFDDHVNASNWWISECMYDAKCYANVIVKHLIPNISNKGQFLLIQKGLQETYSFTKAYDLDKWSQAWSKKKTYRSSWLILTPSLPFFCIDYLATSCLIAS